MLLLLPRGSHRLFLLLSSRRSGNLRSSGHLRPRRHRLRLHRQRGSRKRHRPRHMHRQSVIRHLRLPILQPITLSRKPRGHRKNRLRQRGWWVVAWPRHSWLYLVWRIT